MIKGEWLQNYPGSGMVFVHDTLSEWALQMYEVSLKYLIRS